jgi:hypothetical protein
MEKRGKFKNSKWNLIKRTAKSKLWKDASLSMPVHVGKGWPLLKAVAVEIGLFSRNYSWLQASGPLANQESFGKRETWLPNKNKESFLFQVPSPLQELPVPN